MTGKFNENLSFCHQLLQKKQENFYLRGDNSKNVHIFANTVRIIS